MKGQLIYDEGSYEKIFHKDNLSNLNQHEIDYYENYSWRVGDYIYLSTDNTMYINHSNEPNIDGMSGRALKNIKIGEELTEDYSTFDADFNDYIETYI
jgi:SET domain-containing protein